MKFIKQIILLSLVLVTVSVSAQVEFVARASKQKLGVNERLRIDFEMNQDGDNFIPPSFNNFTVLGGPNQSVSNSWINGIRSFKKTYSYFLAPKQQGIFTIGQASVTVENGIYKTVPLKIEVTKAIDIPKDPDDPNYVAAQNIHLVAEISKTNPYLNEAITVVYKLYVSPRVDVSDWSETDSPRYNDFWSQHIKINEIKAENGTYNGESYRFVVYKKVVLYPQKSGKLVLEPLTLDVTMRVPGNTRDLFGRRMMTQVNKTISAGSKTINVKALPEKGKPANFSGAVGKFDFNVFASKKSLDATESFQLKVEVKGNGNLKLFKLPKVTLPSSLEVYEPEHSEKVTTDLSGMKGSISDNYTIVPQYRGKFPVPSVSFSYFDLKTESYKQLSSHEIIIDVLSGPLNNSAEANSAASPGKQPIVLNADQFTFIKTSPNLVSTDTSYFFKTSAFWTLFLLPFFAIPLAIFIKLKSAIRNADVYGNRIRKADQLAKKYLKGAKQSLGQKEAFYIALEKALHNYLKAKLHIETSDLSKEKTNMLLTERQVNAEVIKDFESILQSCELARYTPIDIVTMQEDYEKAAKTISLIDKQAR